MVFDVGMFILYMMCYLCLFGDGLWLVILCVFGGLGYVILVVVGVWLVWFDVWFIGLFGDGFFLMFCGELEMLICL